MAECPYYNVHFLTLRSNEIRSDRQDSGIRRIPIPYCTHKHSPFEEYVAKKGVMGGANVLRCGGSLAACQVPVDQREDQ